MRRRLAWRGAAAVFVVVALVIVALASAVYWFSKNKAGGGGSAFDLAEFLPQTAQAVWMVNMQGQMDPDKVKGDIEEVLAKFPAEEQAKFKDELEKELGLPWTELVGFFDGRAAVAVIPKADGVGAVSLIGLRDSAGFATYMKSKIPEGTTSEKIGSVDFWFTPEGQYAGHDTQWVYFADSKANAEMLLATVAGKETLATLPLFVEAKSKVAEQGSLFAMYWDIAATAKLLEPMGLPYTDAQTYKDLACLKYAVVSMDFRGHQSNAFLKVESNDSMLSQKLLSKGSVSAASFASLTKETDSGNAIDLEWTFNTLVALAGLSPDGRSQAAMASAGLTFYGNPWGAFEGDLAVTSNWMENLVPILTENFGAAREQGQLVACQSNLKNIGTGLEMWSTDNEGRYPKSMAELSPNYLKTIPDCPAAGTDTYSSSYQVGTNPDSYQFACSGNHHQQAQDNLPAFNSIEGLTAGESVSKDSPEPETPSVAMSAIVKDSALAHGLLAKMLPTAGDEPKPGEAKTYEVPGATLRLTEGTPQRLLAGVGPQSERLFDTKSGTLADKAKLKDALAWGGDGVVYADYMDLRPAMDALQKAVPADGKPETDAFRAVLAKFDGVDLAGASCLAVKPDGLHMRVYGVSSGGLAAVGAAILVPNFIRARGQGQLTGCKSNLKNIGTGLEMWSTDNNGDYPDKLSQLTPDYLLAIPECPAAGVDTYSATYKKVKSEAGDFMVYQVECHGANHESVGVPADYPQYNGDMGLVEQP